MQIDLTSKAEIFEEMAAKGGINNLADKPKRIRTILKNNDYQKSEKTLSLTNLIAYLVIFHNNRKERELE